MEVGLKHINDELVIYSSCGRIDLFPFTYDLTRPPVQLTGLLQKSRLNETSLSLLR